MPDVVATPTGTATESELDAIYQYESQISVYPVQEREIVEIRDCPSEITGELRRASFSEQASGVYTKSQQTTDLDGDETTYDVLTVTVHDGGSTLRLSARDLVGQVSLTPRATVRIDPKISWDDVLDMLLAVYQRQRSIEYHGLPLDQIFGGGSDIEDLLVLLTINLLDGLETVTRRGFIREFNVRRVTAMDGNGRVDLEQTLLNNAQGNPQPTWVQNEIDYDNTVNSLLHYAATTLRRLFRDRAAADELRPQHEQLYAELDHEIQRLENKGITSNQRRVPAYQRLQLYDLPRQRHYYKRALEVAKSVLASSLSHEFDTESQLATDYVMNMESLFEEYSELVLEDELDTLKEYDYVDAFANVSMRDSPVVTPFVNERDIFHQPDHELIRGEDTLAVLDSKYYAEGENPVRKSPTRSQLFSYAYLLDTEELGFLCPLLDAEKRTVAQTGARLSIVSPGEGNFDPETYRAAVHEYLYSVLVQSEPVLEIFKTLARPTSDKSSALCLEDAKLEDLSDVKSIASPFGYHKKQRFSWRIIQRAGRLSWNAGNVTEFEDEGEWARERLIEELQASGRSPHATTCVPVFTNDGRDEWLTLFFVNAGSDGTVESERIELRTV